jgi:hypothetical protein
LRGDTLSPLVSRRRWARLIQGASVPLCLLASFAQAALQADEVFERYGHLVVQVRIVDQASGEKSALGTGFYADAEGYLVTNYHVVADVVQHPDQYLAEMVDGSGNAAALELMNLDVVHDLAILKAPAPVQDAFAFATQSLAKGTRVYSLGNPYDLGSSIVEGTYNGLLENTLYEKIHYTGAINSGMSGGPAILGTGQVVGVNVSTSGDEISFLVPARYAAQLMKATRAADFHKPLDFVDLLRQQLLANQETLMKRLLHQKFERVALGEYRLPARLAPFFSCWGSSTRRKEFPYEIVSHECSTEDEIYVDSEHAAGSIDFQHNLISSSELNPLQFFSLYEASFADDYALVDGSTEQVSRFECTSDFVGHAQSNFKVAFCVRAYKRLRGLYDAVLKVASLNSNRDGVQSTVMLSGVSFENADRFARRYLESIGWREP